MQLFPDSGSIIAVYFFLVLHGVLFNDFWKWMERHKYQEGFSTLIVAAYILIVLGFLALLDWRFALLALGAFAAAGIPMIIGATWRYMKLREKDQDHVKQAP